MHFKELCIIISTLIPCLCVYVVQEPNHHRTYVLLLDCLGHKDLSKVALKTTYYYCRSARTGGQGGVGASGQSDCLEHRREKPGSLLAARCAAGGRWVVGSEPTQHIMCIRKVVSFYCDSP